MGNGGLEAAVLGEDQEIATFAGGDGFEGGGAGG